ncbi:MAG: hypothetical protein ACRDMZ_00530, partial [Solirubrobacteraceae bacterium]
MAILPIGLGASITIAVGVPHASHAGAQLRGSRAVITGMLRTAVLLALLVALAATPAAHAATVRLVQTLEDDKAGPVPVWHVELSAPAGERNIVEIAPGGARNIE